MGVPIEVIFACEQTKNPPQWSLMSLEQFLWDLRKRQRSVVAIVRRFLVLLLEVVAGKETATTMFFDTLSR